MEYHKEVFRKIKDLLLKYLGDKVNDSDEGNGITLQDSNLWISCDDKEIIIGHGINHRHYYSDKEIILDAIGDFSLLLCSKKKTTEYLKGKYPYKIKTEILTKDGNYTLFSISTFMTLLFWKKSKTEITIDEPILSYKTIENDLLQIVNYAQQRV